jgi:ribosome recycling factor
VSDGVLKEFLDDAAERMAKSVDSTRGEFTSVRTGRASPHLLDRVNVDYYGALTPLRQLAQVSASEARLLTITPFDPGSIRAIEKAILESDVGLTPSNDGNVVRLTVPELTEESRRDTMHDLRELKSEGEVGSDDEHRAEEELQKLTDARVAEIDQALAGKEAEILEV